MNKIREGYKMTELGEIPSEWAISKIGELTEIKTGGTPSTKCEKYWKDGDIPWMASGDVNKKIINEVDGRITKSGMENSAAKLLPKDTVMIALNGQGKTKGTVAYLNIELTCNQSLAGFLPSYNVFNSKYLYYNLQSRYFEIRGLAGDGARNGLNLGLLREILIPIPSIKEQEKIASILSTVDEQIDNVDALIEKNKELKKGLMQTLLTKGIGHTKFKKTEIGEIPEEWDVKKLECVFEILDSMRKPIKASDREKIEGNIPYYGASGVIDWINDYIFDEELILLGEDGENLNSRNSDLAFKISGKTWVNNHAHVFRVINKKECNIDFMVYYLEAKDYSIYIAGSAQPKITQAQCRKFLLPLPEKQEQDKIASILLESDKKIEEYENKKQKLEELKKGLMQELLTGMIRVTV
ncbi:restriction endonuclease subunit S [Clostridium sp.]|uniref:restriction endonuclease subunit S n=1 Tax=Clostridium sp. TaxID=1506 RepID=UPI002E79E9E2|nr:restriction endonuclease subunit S [Clostridium sp.]MEE0568019.1 restriction endonuclease subunit S [Clostridium sp.]